MNIVEHMSLLPAGESFGYMPRRGIAGSSGSGQQVFYCSICMLLIFHWIFSFFISQMLSPFPYSSPDLSYPIPSPHTSMSVLPHPPTYSHLTDLSFSYTGQSSIHGNKGLFPHWCQTMASSATYAAGTMSPSTCILCWMVLSLRALGSLLDFYCCSS